MLTESTVTKLREMRMSVMASTLKDQLSDPQYRNMEFEDRSMQNGMRVKVIICADLYDRLLFQIHPHALKMWSICRTET